MRRICMCMKDIFNCVSQILTNDLQDWISDKARDALMGILQRILEAFWSHWWQKVAGWAMRHLTTVGKADVMARHARR